MAYSFDELRQTGLFTCDKPVHADFIFRWLAEQNQQKALVAGTPGLTSSHVERALLETLSRWEASNPADVIARLRQRCPQLDEAILHNSGDVAARLAQMNFWISKGLVSQEHCLKKVL
eukprot:gnl/MRDRNA2_/MRDRNA2_198549_c0_seq1.p1 gnl/MRDRNA2_/MRDRNA2_198549_c0~~gnl/MRDRNA2_/MRDRNA2_198549_c0_seq1.p1  ORF type:complete len:118 (-),score=13.99 gnl/MRDRNA2_/MRDRNA2_198549_c0_seq1:64-417(-)